MRSIVVAVTGALLLWPTAAAWADTPPDRPVRWTLPDWLVRPTSSQLLAVWPVDAVRKGLNGRVMIHCRVSRQGALFGCEVDSESPPGEGFGAAALALTPQFVMKPATRDGQPAESQVEIPINFSGLEPTHPQQGPQVVTGSRIPGDAHAASVAGAQQDPHDRIVSSVRWLEAPSYAQVVAGYPAKASAAKVGGHVALNCRFGAEGRLSSCDVISEIPSGYGFGAAARALARDFVGPSIDAGGTPLIYAAVQVAFTFAPEMLSGQAPVIGKPLWTRLPDTVAVAQGFPAAAVAAHVSTGHVMLECGIGAEGRLDDCSVARQDPPGLGFDKAALELAPLFQVSVWTDEGLPTVGGRISVPFRYEAPTGP
jgi:TonB family protein